MHLCRCRGVNYGEVGGLKPLWDSPELAKPPLQAISCYLFGDHLNYSTEEFYYSLQTGRKYSDTLTKCTSPPLEGGGGFYKVKYNYFQCIILSNITIG